MRIYDYAKNILHWDDEKSMQILVLGNVHDIEYEFESSLKGFPFAEEIRYHSNMQDKYYSSEMNSLYCADATVNGIGN